jgi:hypothetical protein
LHLDHTAQKQSLGVIGMVPQYFAADFFRALKLTPAGEVERAANCGCRIEMRLMHAVTTNRGLCEAQERNRIAMAMSRRVHNGARED